MLKATADYVNFLQLLEIQYTTCHMLVIGYTYNLPYTSNCFIHIVHLHSVWPPDVYPYFLQSDLSKLYVKTKYYFDEAIDDRVTTGTTILTRLQALDTTR